MDRIFEAYNGEGGFSREFARKSRERIHWTCSQVWGRKVLDVGCSQGIGPILLGRMGYEVMGIDINPEAIAYAKKELAKETEEVRRKVQFSCVNFLQFKNDDWTQVDAIVMGEVLEHLVRPADFIAKAFQLMKPAGRLVVTVPFGINDDPDHRQTFYLTNIYTLLHPFFDIVGVKFLGAWVGFITRRREEKTSEQPQIPLSLFRQAEEAFYNLERPLRDNLLTAQAAVKRANEATVAAKATVGAEVDVVETKVTELKTELEVERGTSRGYQEQIAVLKAMLQFVSSQQKPAEQNPVDEQKLLAYSQETRELRDDNAALRDRNGELKMQLAVSEVEKSHLKERLESVGSTISATEKKAAEALEMAEMYEAENAEVRDKEASLVKTIETLSAEKQELELEKEELVERNATLEVQREESQSAVVRIAEERTRLDQALAQTRIKLAESQDEAVTLRTELAAAQSASGDACATAAALERDISRIKETNAALKLELQQSRNHLEKQSVALAELNAENKSLKTSLAQTKAIADEVAGLRAALDDEKSWATQHKAEFDSYRDRVATEMATLSADSTTDKNRIAELEAALSAAEKTAAKELALHKKFSAQAYEANKQNTLFASQLERSREEIVDLKTKLAAAEKELLEKSHFLQTCEERCSAELKAHKRFSAEACLLRRQVATMKGEMVHMQKVKQALERKYEKLAKSKLGRLTLKYWAFKDGKRSKPVDTKKAVSGEPVSAVPVSDDAAWTKQRENEERFFRKA